MMKDMLDQELAVGDFVTIIDRHSRLHKILMRITTIDVAPYPLAGIYPCKIGRPPWFISEEFFVRKYIRKLTDPEVVFFILKQQQQQE